MTVDTPSSLPGSPEAPRETRPIEAPGADDAGSAPEARSFEAETPTDDAAVRPQADFGAPISLEDGDGETAAAGDDEPGVPRVTGGDVPPLYAMADDDAERVLAEPRTIERPLTRRIHQGMPSYSEPDPEIAGVVGRAARGREEGPELDDPGGPTPRDGGTP